ncbi:MAG TPA: VanZ family protein [Chthoniobacterales bacterium]|nr:VanZ family protein [Chthoniobacterales bacterium]
MSDTTLRAVELSNVRSFLRYWLPVLAWMLLIFIASTDLMSAQHTSRFIGPFLRWISPNVSAETIAAVQFGVRKAAHVTEYAILAALVLRALHRGWDDVRWSRALVALATAISYAAVDEYHQSFVASRTGSPADVAIDACGAAIGVSIWCWAVSRRRGAARQHEAHALP